jgi:hypothetical protein
MDSSESDLSKTTTENLRLFYQENAKIAAIFWEWRHKVMTYFIGSVTGLLALAGWLYQQGSSQFVLVLPLLSASLFGLLSHRLDRRNVEVLVRCLDIGAEIEAALFGKGAIFAFIKNTHRSSPTYTPTLHRMYHGSSIVFVLIAGLIALGR